MVNPEVILAQLGNPTQLKEAYLKLARENYSFYVEYVHRGLYYHGQHTRLICDALQQVDLGNPDYKRIIITLPPRHSKSMSVTETFPSYFIGKNPERRVIQASYGDSLARKFGRANKNKIENFGRDIFDITVSRDTSAVDNWGIKDHRGGMISAGIGGSITGEGADLLIIDDPIKNREEADSLVYREKVWNEWQNTLRTRLHPGAAVIIIVTRWHHDDLVGRLLNPEYGEVEPWLQLNLPAICEEEGDLLGRSIGQSLWPEHGFDEKWAEATKKAVGIATWTSLYQQRPTPSAGAMVEKHWWRYYNKPYDPLTNTIAGHYIDEFIQSWDMTFKDSEGTDLVVGQVWARSAAYKFLVDQVRARMNFPVTLVAVQNLSAKWPKARLKLIEDKANGPAIIAMLHKKIGGLVPVDPKNSKIARVSACSPDIESGNVFIPSPEIAPWVTEFVEEWAAFPKGVNDDQVDGGSQALNRLVNHIFVSKPGEADNTTSEQKKLSKHIRSIAKRHKHKSSTIKTYVNRY